MATRRRFDPDRTTSSTSSTMNGTVKPPSTPAQSARRGHPLTSTETLLFAAYPLTLVLGSLWSTLTVSSTASPYNYVTQSHDPATAPSYFARKDNVVNVWFVKKGWLWMTAAVFLLHYYQHVVVAPHRRRLVQAALRFAAATTVWILVTQWAFGPPLVDRTFALSGGLCDVSARAAEEEQRAADPLLAGVKKVEGIVTGAGCRAAGGLWVGGHDISGHVFLLILGSGMLVLEALPYLPSRRLQHPSLSDDNTPGQDAPRGGGETHFAVKTALAIASLSWWMLLMTAAYFHTWFEKFTGLAVALAALSAVYVLPRELESLHRIFGRPGL